MIAMLSMILLCVIADLFVTAQHEINLRSLMLRTLESTKVIRATFGGNLYECGTRDQKLILTWVNSFSIEDNKVNPCRNVEISRLRCQVASARKERIVLFDLTVKLPLLTNLYSVYALKGTVD